MEKKISENEQNRWNFLIENEIIVNDNNLIHEIIVINKQIGTKIRNKKDIMFGPILLKEMHQLFQEKCLLKSNHLWNNFFSPE